jgi:hypothetical protein
MPITDPPTGDAALPGVYYIDYFRTLSMSPPDPDFGSRAYYCARPENLSMDDSMGGVGNASWDWSFSALDVEGNPIVVISPGEDFIHPWRSWFRLRCGNTVIMSGPIVGTSAKLGEESVKIAGQSWEAYFPRWQYPFDPRPTHVNDYRYPKTFIGNEDPGHIFGAGGSGANTPQGLAYQAQNRDLALIARDLLVQIRDAVPDRLHMDFTDLATPVGITTNFQYTLGDVSSIDSTLTSLTGIGEGFDFWVGQDRIIRVGSPYRFGSALSPSIAYFIDVNTPGLLEAEYQNQGIQGNHVSGRGAGLSSQNQMGAAYGYAASQDEFSRLDIAYDYGDVRNRNQLERLTKKSLSLIINPIRDVPITLDPAAIIDSGINFWATFRRGVALYITIDTLFHQIDAPYRLRGWQASDSENTGNFEVNLTLDRIYPTVADFGNPSL